jgi:FixJ family two-component response regulator
VNTKKASLGLGLAICWSIVRAYGGTAIRRETRKRRAGGIDPAVGKGGNVMSDIFAVVHLVDDDERVLVALKRLLAVGGYHVELHRSAEEFLDRHDPDAPGCVVVDLGLPGIDGFGIQEALAAAGEVRPIIFLTGCGDIPASVRAMRAGAVDFLTKPVNARQLIASIELAFRKERDMRQASHERRVARQRLASLTPREREVFGCVVAGRLNKQIAADLGTVEKTIKVHRGRMMEKMKVRTVADLVRLAGTAGFP